MNEIIDRKEIRTMKKFILLLSLLAPVAGFAQTYAIDWYKVAGGGGVSAGANGGNVYLVSGTIGHCARGQQRVGGVALLGDLLRPATKHKPGDDQLDGQRVFRHDPQRHQQHHHYAAFGEFVLQIGPALTAYSCSLTPASLADAAALSVTIARNFHSLPGSITSA